MSYFEVVLKLYNVKILTLLIFVGTGDFFSDDLPKADLYIFSRILHDWSDEKVHKLLSKLSKACTPGKNIRSADLTIRSKLHIFCINYQY